MKTQFADLADKIELIAEPGRFFVHAAATLFVNVTAKRKVRPNVPDLAGADSSGTDSSGEDTDVEHDEKRPRPGSYEQGFRYYVNDGCYGSFNCIMYDHRENLFPEIMMDGEGNLVDIKSQRLYDCSVFGNTCDGIDRISASCALPDVPIGTWFGYTNMGAYTSAAASSFNGFSVTKTTYV